MIDPLTMEVTATVWVANAKAAWHFITLPTDESEKIRFFSAVRASAWGAVRVDAKIGKTRWKTSLFPDSKVGAYLLPIKSTVRKVEKISAGDSIAITLIVAT